MQIPDRVLGDLSSGLYDPTAGQWNYAGLSIIGTTAASSYALHKFADSSIDGTTTDRALGDGSQWISLVGSSLPYALPVGFFIASRWFDSSSAQRNELTDTTMQLVEALGFTFATTTALKYGVGRERPDGSNDRSFPSGHTSMAFAAASVMAYRYPWYIGVPSLAFASAVGFTRVDLRMHYASDVAMGAGIGLFFATAVHQYHRQLQSHSRSAPRVPLLPMFTQNTYGFSWFKSF